MFVDRNQAGRELARTLWRFRDSQPLVLALPRGGVPIAREIAQFLQADLDVLIVRKLGVPGNPEFAFGAVGEDGTVVVDAPTVANLAISDGVRDQIIAEAVREIDRRVDTYRNGNGLPPMTDRTVIIVDDGLATGSTAAAGVAVVRALGAAHIILAVPTGSREAVASLSRTCDEVVCLEQPEWFGSVGAQYEQFPQVSDAEVTSLLTK